MIKYYRIDIHVGLDMILHYEITKESYDDLKFNNTSNYIVFESNTELSKQQIKEKVQERINKLLETIK